MTTAAPGHGARKPKRTRTPTVLQMEAVECGAASLAMVLGFHRRWVALEELRLKCGVTRDGSKASNVLKAARGYGMIARGFKREPAELRAMPLPMVVFWNFNHFLVVEGFAAGRVFLNDPGSGRRAVPDAEFDQSFTGVVLTFEPGPDFTPGGSAPSVWAALGRRCAGLSDAIAYLVLAGLALVVPGLLLPVFSSAFIDRVLVSGLQDWWRPLILGVALTAGVRAALTWLQGYYLLRARTRLALAAASRFFWHALRLPVEFYTQRSPGEIGARLAINDRVAATLTGDLAQALLAVLQALFFALVMFFYDIPLTLVSLTVAALNVAVMAALARRTREASQRLAIDSGRVVGASMNGLLVMETLKSCGGESGFFARWAGYQARLSNSEQAMARSALVPGALPGLLAGLNAALLLGVGALRVMDGHLSIGMLVAFQSLSASFIGPVQSLVALGRKMLELEGDMHRLDDVTDYAEDPWTAQPGVRAPMAAEVEGGAAGAPAAAARLQGRVEFRDVSFGYNRTDVALIENFSLVLEPGKRVAVVGPSGCGKSTVSRLLAGLYRPWEGQILFDGRPREEWGRFEFAAALALVDQDVVLFDGSVRDNITMWDRSLAEADVLRAARDACIHDAIMARPGGYEARMEEGGTNLSGGQRQRIEIARALVANPRVLVLDEATSALDADTEKRIDDNLRRRGCACLIIAHRLSTIRDADEIVVMSHGRIVERGTHAGLAAIAGGHYARLIAAH
jgi:NHLM bacteriocin system ABC transporter peptidase/ATP-binding protein